MPASDWGWNQCGRPEGFASIDVLQEAAVAESQTNPNDVRPEDELAPAREVMRALEVEQEEGPPETETPSDEPTPVATHHVPLAAVPGHQVCVAVYQSAAHACPTHRPDLKAP
jgi:hypothetical protein